jgi:hypothetical protein
MRDHLDLATCQALKDAGFDQTPKQGDWWWLDDTMWLLSGHKLPDVKSLSLLKIPSTGELMDAVHLLANTVIGGYPDCTNYEVFVSTEPAAWIERGGEGDLLDGKWICDGGTGVGCLAALWLKLKGVE